MKRIINYFAIVIMMVAVNANAGDVLATYNGGKKITKSDVTKWVLAQTGGRMPEGKSSMADVSESAKKEIFKQYAVQQQVVALAEKAKIPQSDKFKQQMENARLALMVKMYLEKYADNKMSNSLLKAEYSKFVDAMKKSDDLEVSHIVVATESEANDVYKKLKKGGKFEDLAKKHSMEKATKDNGGKFGTISRGQFNPKYEKAAYKLRKGKFSKPVEIESNWFIIKLDNKTKRKIPSFDQVKPQMEMLAKEEILKKYLEGMAKNTKIKLVD